ncbi:uncharacterized protein BROUX77_000205 [Berkeleyomyces rouxiae]|uniref:uncharacterized protein n=1 Tax=Berkeleyomyces rouxiae TaxID=2035830 RepID=UPI003B78A556
MSPTPPTTSVYCVSRFSPLRTSSSSHGVQMGNSTVTPEPLLPLWAGSLPTPDPSPISHISTTTPEVSQTPSRAASGSFASSGHKDSLDARYAAWNRALDVFAVKHFWDLGGHGQIAIEELFKSIQQGQNQSLPVIAAWYFTLNGYLQQSNSALESIHVPLRWQISFDGDRYLRLMILESGIPRKEVMWVYCQPPQQSQNKLDGGQPATSDNSGVSPDRIPLAHPLLSCTGGGTFGGAEIQQEQWYIAIEEVTNKLKATAPQNIVQVVIALGACSLWLIWDPSSPRFPPLCFNPTRMDGWADSYRVDPVWGFSWYLDKNWHAVPRPAKTVDTSGEILSPAFLGLNHWVNMAGGSEAQGGGSPGHELNRYSLLSIEQSILQMLNFQSAGMAGHRMFMRQHLNTSAWEIGEHKGESAADWDINEWQENSDSQVVELSD